MMQRARDEVRTEVRLNEGLATLAKKHLVEGSDVERTLGWQRFGARKPAAARGVAWSAWAIAGASALAAVAIVLVTRSPQPSGHQTASLSYTAVGVRQRAPELLQALDESPAAIAFSDGSRLDLAAHSLLEVQSRDNARPRLRLTRGRAHVSIKPDKSRRWQVEAGPFGVAVKGTQFRLSWQENRQHLEVELYTGAVDVTGPLLEQGLAMRAGQRLDVDLENGQLHVVPLEEDTPQNEAKVAAPSDAEPPPGEPATSPRPETTSRARAPWAALGWAARIDRRDAAGVLADAQARGLPKVFALAHQADLWALADAARYLQQDDVASKTLTAFRKRFPRAREAASAAFFLGRRQEQAGDAAKAIEWYDTSLREAPKGPFAAEAMGRKLVIASRASSATLRRALAETYLRRFPDGSYASLARTLLAL